MSALTTAPVPSNELPPEVITCLKNARYLHLATTNALWPHVSLMNYTYLPSSPYPTTSTSSGPIIILTVQPDTKKTHNLLANPRVSLLVHDWVSHRPSFSSAPPSDPQPSSLADLLTNINTAALSSISATLFGYAELVERGTEAETYYRKTHSENNSGGGESRCYLEGDGMRVVVVRVAWARVADYRGFVRDWVASGEEAAWTEFEKSNGTSNGTTANAPSQVQVNGV
ncbi:hypothetical protein EDC01DRAFT_318697 [Geopyxis carbonaria]|nr:hypothetical protein EDC01DRAFT_318697 [Geopyxis carbonaria]